MQMKLNIDEDIRKWIAFLSISKGQSFEKTLNEFLRQMMEAYK